MSDWNSELYLKFKNERTQPSIDLAKRIKKINPEKILDIGCGPGNSTSVLKEVFPGAEILGIDSSPNMIEKAEKSHSNLRFELVDAEKDLYKLENNFDIIFSNACLQWIPNHKKLIPEIMEKLSLKGVLAVQMPENSEEPLFKIIAEVTKESKWNFDNGLFDKNRVLKTEEYFEILSCCASDFDIWETIYYHRMPDCRAMLEWVKSTRLKPFLSCLDDLKKAELENEIFEKAQEVYKTQNNGEIIFRFKRLFFTAVK